MSEDDIVTLVIVSSNNSAVFGVGLKCSVAVEFVRGWVNRLERLRLGDRYTRTEADWEKWPLDELRNQMEGGTLVSPCHPLQWAVKLKDIVGMYIRESDFAQETMAKAMAKMAAVAEKEASSGDEWKGD